MPHFKCDGDSLNFKLLGMCSHSVAVAELNKQLKEFIATFTKSKRKANFSQLAMHGMPSGHENKGSQDPRKRRQSQPTVERLSSAMNSTRSSASQIVGGSNNHMLNIHLDPACLHTHPCAHRVHRLWPVVHVIYSTMDGIIPRLV